MIQLMHGNTAELLKTFENESVNCVVTSPPYWRLRDYGHTEQIGLEETPEQFINNLCNIFDEVYRVLRKDGKSVFFIEGRKHEEVKLEKRMFENVKVGDCLYSPRFGKGIVIKVEEIKFEVKFENYFFETAPTYRKFYKNGKMGDWDKEPTIFWEKPKMEYIKERPFSLEEEMKKLKVKEWEYGVRNAFLVYWVSCKKIKIEATNIFRQIGVIYFEYDIALREFEDKIVGREISFEEFERCYKKVFLEGK